MSIFKRNQPTLNEQLESLKEQPNTKCTAKFTGEGRKDETPHQISKENERLTAKVNELERKLAYTELEQPSQNVIDDLVRYRKILPPDFWSFEKIEKLVELYDKMKDILGEEK